MIARNKILIRLEEFKKKIFNKINIKSSNTILFTLERKGFYGRDPSKKHSYQNPNLVLTSVVDKSGKITYRLTNPNKKEDFVQISSNFYFNHENDKNISDYFNYQAMNDKFRKKVKFLSKYTNDEIKEFATNIERLAGAIKNKTKYLQGENITVKDDNGFKTINLNEQLNELSKYGNVKVIGIDVNFSNGYLKFKFPYTQITENLNIIFKNNSGFFFLPQDKSWNYSFNKEVMLYDLNTAFIKLYDLNMLLKMLYDNNIKVYNDVINKKLNPNQATMYAINFNNMKEFFDFIDETVSNVKLNIEYLPKFVDKVLKDIFGLKVDLHPFQLNAIAFHNLNRNSIYIGDEMGLGKTLQAISTMLAKGKLPVLVITPAFLKENFAKDIEKFYGDSLSIYVIESGKSDWKPEYMRKGTNWENPFESLLKEETSGYDVLIINYEQLGKYLDDLKKVDWRGVIIDEAHFIKNFNAQRTQYVLDILKNLDKRATKIMMSGTAITNSPYDLMPQLVGLNTFWYIAKDKNDFINKYIEPKLIKSVGGKEIYDYRKGKNLDDLHAKLKLLGYIRREKEEVLDQLPEVLRIDQYLELPDRKNYDKITQEFEKFLKERYGENYFQSLTPEKIEILKQLHQTRHLMRESALQKVELLDSIYDQLFEEKPDRKIIVFGYSREVVNKIINKTNDYLSKLNKELKANYKSVVLTSDIPVNKRQPLVEEFTNNPDAKIFITSLDVGGTGLNLQVADTVIFTELDFEPQLFLQAEGRVARLGQKASKVNNIYLLGKDTIDEPILQYIIAKANQMQKVIKGDTKKWFEKNK